MTSDRNATHIKRRGQSAMEYLITYGWAILLVAIIVSLLYLYVVVPHIIVPSSCSFVSGAYCNDIVLGSNAITHATKIGLFLTNTQPYPIANPVLYANINGANTTQYLCKPSFIFPGGTIICIANITQTTTLGQFLAGTLYLKALYCGFSAKPASSLNCTTTAPTEIYTGKFNAHAEPLVSTTSSITLTAKNTTNPGNPANNAKDPLYATVKLLGYPLHGATVNFTAYYSNGTSATPPYSISPAITTTGTAGVADSAIWGDVTGNVTVEASYAGYNATVPVRFIPTVHVTLNVSDVKPYLSNSALPIINIAGTNYNYTQLQKSFVWGCGSSHSYAFVKIPYNSSGTRSVFKSVTIDGLTYTSTTGTVNVTCTNQTILTSYFVQYYFNEIANASTSGTVFPGDEWENASTSILISETPNTGFFFKNWTCSGSGCYAGTATSTTVVLNDPITEQANFYSSSTSTTSTTSTTTSSTSTSTSTTSTSTSTTSTTTSTTSTTTSSTSTTTSTTSTTTSTTTSSTTSSTTSTSIPYCNAGYTAGGSNLITGSSSTCAGTTAGVAYLVCGAGVSESISTLNWTPESEGGGTCQYCSTNIGDVTASSCSLTPQSTSAENGVLGAESVPTNYPASVLFRANASIGNGVVGNYTPTFTTSSAYGLIIVVYTGSTTETTTNNYLLNGTYNNGLLLLQYYNNYLLTTGGSVACSQNQDNSSYTSIFGVNMADEVAYVTCSNVPSGTYTAPTWRYQDGASYSIAVYGFSASTSTSTSTTTTQTTTSTSISSSCSLYGNSKVLLANGTYVVASQLKPGTAIMSYNPASNATQPSIISSILKGHALNRYTFSNNLTVDSQETMLINGRWMLAGSSKVGDMIYDPLTKHNVPITSINISYNGGTIYDIYDQPINNFITYGGYVVDGVTSTGGDSCSVVGYDTIALANGSYAPASEIKVGQSLMSYNLKNKSAAPTVVTGVKSFNVTQIYIINNNLTIDASETLLVNGNFSTAANLKIGDYLFNPLSGQNVKVASLNIVNSSSRVYDINTAPIDAYIANGYMIT